MKFNKYIKYNKVYEKLYLNIKYSDSLLFHLPFEPEYKRARQEIKKKSSDTLKLQKKAKKGKKKTYFIFDLRPKYR